MPDKKSLSFLSGQNIKALSSDDSVKVTITPTEENGTYKLIIEATLTSGFIENDGFKDRKNTIEPSKPGAIWERGEVELGIKENLVSEDVEPTIYLSSNTSSNIYLNVVLSLSTNADKAFKPWQLKRDWQLT